MSRRLKTWIMLSPAFFCLLLAECYADQTKMHLTLAILPCTDVVRNFKKFQPLINYLQQQTESNIEMIMPNSLAELKASLQNGSIDFVLQDPHSYGMIADLYNKDSLLLALTREGTTSQRGLIIARKDTGIRNVVDLKGKTVMFGPKLSIAKWIAARGVFSENGIDIDKDLKTYINGGCCEDIAFNVYLRAVDAGVVCDHFLAEHSENQEELGIDVKQIAIIATTKPAPTKVFAAGNQIGKDVVTRMERALLALDRGNPEHARILYPAELGGFLRPGAEEYDRIKDLINQGLEQ